MDITIEAWVGSVVAGAFFWLGVLILRLMISLSERAEKKKK